MKLNSRSNVSWELSVLPGFVQWPRTGRALSIGAGRAALGFADGLFQLSSSPSRVLLFVQQCKWCFINQEGKHWGECKLFLTWASQSWNNVLHPPESCPSRDLPVLWCGTAVLIWCMCYCYTKILFPEVLRTAGKSICSEQTAAAWQVTVQDWGALELWPCCRGCLCLKRSSLKQ